MNAVRRAVGFVFDGDLALGVGPDELQFARFPQAGVVFDQAMGQVDRQRHERAAFPCRRSRTSSPGRRRRPTSTPMAMLPRLGVQVANRPGRCRPRSRSSDRCSRSRESSCGRCRPWSTRDRSALVVISPETTARSVVTSVSQATRLIGSAAEAVIENGIADLVGHLVRMAHGDGFTGEQVAVCRSQYVPFAEIRISSIPRCAMASLGVHDVVCSVLLTLRVRKPIYASDYHRKIPPRGA